MKRLQRYTNGAWLLTATLFALLVATPHVWAAAPERISLTAAHQALLGEEPVTFVDTRNENEWHAAATMLPGAVRVYTQADLQRAMNELPKERFIIPYCT